jgi:hypothetical protein
MKRWIKELLLKNWNLKATALFLALILWIFVRGEPGPERIVTVPLEVRVPRQMEIINKRPSSIEVTMRGAPISNLWFSQPLPTCVIDLQAVGEGEHVVPLTPDNIKISKGSSIEVLQVNPARVTIILEPTVSKEIPVVVPMKGELLKGFEIYGKYSKPSAIIISGPRSQIAAMREVRTTPVSLEGRNRPNRFFVDLTLKNSSIRTSVQNPILVEVTIGPARELHTIQGVPITIDNNSYITTPKQIEIQVLTTPDSIPNITPKNFLASVKTPSPETGSLPIRVKPTVQILHDFEGALLIKAIHPSEVTLQRRK